MAESGEQEVGGIVLPLTVDTSGFKDGLKESEEAGNSFLEFWEGAAESFAGFFGVEMVDAVREFAVETVSYLAKLDQAYDVTAQMMTRLGGTYDDNRLKVEQYAATVMRLTQFNKLEVTQSLNSIINRTQDYSAALKINALAMDIVAREPSRNLLQTATQLALAYQGNTFGLRDLSRELGMTTHEAKDASNVFKILADRFGGASTAVDNAETNLDKFENMVRDTAESIADRLVPALSAWGRALRALNGDDIAALQTKIESLKASIKDTRSLMARGVIAQTDAAEESLNHWILELHTAEAALKKAEGALPGEAGIGDLSKGAGKNQKREQAEQDAEEAAKKRLKNQAEYAKEVKDADDERLSARTRIEAMDDKDMTVAQKSQALAAMEADAKAKIAALDAEIARLGNDGTQASLDNLKALKQQVEGLKEIDRAQHQLAEKQKEDQKELARLISAGTEKAFAKFFTMAIKGTHDMTSAFKALAKSMGTAMLDAVAKIVEGWAEANLLQGIAAATNPLTAASAPGFFAAAAVETAGAGGIEAIAASLAEGGVVNPAPGGHLVRVAEAGEAEVVSPLSKLPGLLQSSGGGGIRELHQHFPGVRDRREVEGTHRTAARALVSVLNRTKIRSGNRGSAI